MNISVRVQNVCVSAAGWAASGTARCSQTRWAADSPCGNAPGGRYSGTLDPGSAPAHTCKHTHAHGGLTCDEQPFCSTCTNATSFTCPCASTSSRWRTVPPSIPLRTYWPEAELLSLTRKSPLQVRRDSACSRPNLRPRIQSEGKRDADIIGVDISELRYRDVNYPPAMKPALLLNQVLDPCLGPLLSADLWFHWAWWCKRRRI